MKKILLILNLLPVLIFGQSNDTYFKIPLLIASKNLTVQNVMTVADSATFSGNTGFGVAPAYPIHLNTNMMVNSAGSIYFTNTSNFLTSNSSLIVLAGATSVLTKIASTYYTQLTTNGFSPYADLGTNLGQDNAKWAGLWTNSIEDSSSLILLKNPIYVGSGTVRGEIYMNSSDLVVRNFKQDGDLQIGVNDGGSSQIAIEVDGATTNVEVKGQLTTDNTHAELFEDSPTVKATVAIYRTIVSLQAGLYNEAVLGDSSITVNQAGRYMVQYHASFTHSVNNTVCHMSFFVNDVENTKLEDEQKVGVAGDVGSVAGSCLVDLSANDVLKIKATSDNAGNMTINHFNFNVVRIK